jgi:type II secretory pathway component GspD/PulD (secretin)
LILIYFRLSVFLLFAVVHCYFTIFTIQSAHAETESFKGHLFSLQFRNDTLGQVFNELSKASGYEIRYNTQFKEKKVTIQLKNVDINEALTRVLKSYNHLSVWDDVNRVVTVLVFNQNSPPVTISGVNGIFELATETTNRP